MADAIAVCYQQTAFRSIRAARAVLNSPSFGSADAVCVKKESFRHDMNDSSVGVAGGRSLAHNMTRAERELERGNLPLAR